MLTTNSVILPCCFFNMAFSRQTIVADVMNVFDSVGPPVSLAIVSIDIATILVSVIMISFVCCREGFQNSLELC